VLLWGSLIEEFHSRPDSRLHSMQALTSCSQARVEAHFLGCVWLEAFDNMGPPRVGRV
jgi:hypothetical protein